MMANWMIGWLLGVALGLLLGRWIARDSAKAKPVQGGMAAVLHYLACSLIVAGAPTALAVVILNSEVKFVPRLLTVVALVFFNLLVAALCLIGQAALESRRPGMPPR
jgi:hypothetical protein